MIIRSLQLKRLSSDFLVWNSFHSLLNRSTCTLSVRHCVQPTVQLPGYMWTGMKDGARTWTYEGNIGSVGPIWQSAPSCPLLPLLAWPSGLLFPLSQSQRYAFLRNLVIRKTRSMRAFELHLLFAGIVFSVALETWR